ncbi:hypothetical protein TELCIR_06337 [Teladorsagia circumcincta]|uniref:Uncharacterized protein n=1 Tax=Teladorsagia circumcincta TaxID=45464 RepID=A0A2G9UQL3_TELCI|nr:hypothetical protein TELCIR_06337 [Teladorsagia circumcincta]
MPESDSYESDIKGDMPKSGTPKLQLKGTPVHSTPPPLSKKKFTFCVWSWTVRWAPKIQKLAKVPQSENGTNKKRPANLKDKKTGGIAPH